MPRWDPGLQPERTALAWLRTSLTFLVLALVAVQLTAVRHVALAAVLTATALPLTATVGVLAWRRYRRGTARLRGNLPLPDGRLPAASTALAVTVGLLGVAYVLLG
ncbi:hypothetical protein GCM10012275_00650 [Longimycelium tulufanense]|uniref:DUF202 domain-containing protein n=1 Tax=Longimycelium tulufanense TaxID=907463 RepID=A0A8J3C5H6_9PSEU|nr:DUF202 domain-containing protein [Longimycelium tulufanense]GGM33080.1 hypothetical protein GCM10012275_00650 [Longimycelium tulufanense]